MYHDNKNLVACCGLYCGSCGIYLATHENDSDKIVQYAIVLNQLFDETLCDGCRADRKSAHCSKRCKFVECATAKGIWSCAACDVFPCQELTEFQSIMPHRTEIVKSLNRLKEIGWENWLFEMKEKFSCPRCNTVNNAYDIACRKCGNTPGCEFVTLHREMIERYLSEE